MAKGRKVGLMCKTRRRFLQKRNGSDESDQEYNVGENESDEDCFLEDDESEEFLSDFEDEEEEYKDDDDDDEEEEEEFKEEEEEEEEEEDGEEEEEEEYKVEEEEEEENKVPRMARSRKGRRILPREKRNVIKQPQKKRRVSYEQEEDDDDDYKIEDDEEFMMDESDSPDDEDEVPVVKKNWKVSKPPLKQKHRNSKVKSFKQKIRKNHGQTGKLSSNRKKIKDKIAKVQEKSKKTSGRKKKRSIMADSDSDFASSVSFGCEYTISEEEREQVREAGKICRNLRTSLRSSSSCKNALQEEDLPCKQRKRQLKKGKEKVEDVKSEFGNQVCGICLTEAGKRTVRGSLNCCSHYFCFACIVEWSKVESRCPLCKQRFATISKPAKSTVGFDLRNVVIQVPERDQVYQPTEEELRAFLNPYEAVICTECREGGEDHLMLLCDICDSPAHTFCVGLGYQVPDGNWYCEGCRPAALNSPVPRNPIPNSDEGSNRNASPGLLSSPLSGGIDLNAAYIPETPHMQESMNMYSIRPSLEDFRASAASTGTSALTVHERRRINRGIEQVLNNNRMTGAMRSSHGTSTATSSSGIRLFGYPINQARVIAPQRTNYPERVSQPLRFSEGNDTSPTMQPINRNLVSPRSSTLRGQGQNSASVSTSQGGFERLSAGFNTRLVYGQLQPCTTPRSSMDSDVGLSPLACREAAGPSRASQGEGLPTPF